MEKGNFNELIGIIENESLEFKGSPYHQLSLDAIKQELAKDIAGFANADGLLFLSLVLQRQLRILIVARRLKKSDLLKKIKSMLSNTMNLL